MSPQQFLQVAERVSRTPKNKATAGWHRQQMNTLQKAIVPGEMDETNRHVCMSRFNSLCTR